MHTGCMFPGTWIPLGSAGLAINPLNNTSPCKTISVSVNKGVSKTMQQNGPPRITQFFQTVAQELSLPTMEDLVTHVHSHRRFLPKAGSSIETIDQEVMKLCELQQGTYPESHRIYQQDPPNCLASLLQWHIIGGLLTLVSDQAQTDLMDISTSPPVTRRVAPWEDPPPLPPPSHPPPPPPTWPPPSAAGGNPDGSEEDLQGGHSGS